MLRIRTREGYVQESDHWHRRLLRPRRERPRCRRPAEQRDELAPSLPDASRASGFRLEE
jgi:hypothetical protein